MKKCPTCDKTFEDNMRFCQVDGTPLIDDAPAFDPYATIVAPAGAIMAEPEEKPAEEATEPASAPENATVSSIPIEPPDDVLEMPEADPLKTMYVSESELRDAMSGGEQPSEPEVIDLQPAAEEGTADAEDEVVTSSETVPEPEPPSFSVPDVPAPSFGSPSPPPSPFSEPEPPPSPYSGFPESAEPASEPFQSAPSKPSFDEAATVMQPGFGSQFTPPAPAPVAEWNPPPAPEPSWQNQEIGSNTPFQSPPAGTSGDNKTLAIVSLVAGILGLTLCCGWFVPSIVAIITGVMARSKANQDPQQYGGAGLAMAGIITGSLGLVGGLIVIILYFVVGLASLGLG